LCNATVTDPLKIVGRAIRAARKEWDWSQEALGERADLHRNEIGVIERGEVNCPS
jgi:DNA-binding XRE family transcriptional regulator